VKVITINVGSSSEWLDPSTVLLSFLITNNDANHDLFPATPDPSCLFERLQIRLGSTLVEDIQQFGKLTDLMTKLSMSPQKKMDHYQTGFGVRSPGNDKSYFQTSSHLAELIGHTSIDKSRRVYMKFNLSGLFSQEKWIPLFALGGQGLQIQLHLAPAAQAVVKSNGGTTYSTDYTLSDIRLLADMCSLSGDLQSSYNEALLAGTTLKMPIKSWECITNYLPTDSAGSFDVAISKNYTRLATLFAVFNQTPPSDDAGLTKLVNTH